MSIKVMFQYGYTNTYDSFDQLINLESYNDIYVITCCNTKLTEFPELPKSLKELNCKNNELIKLPELPKTIKNIQCSYNNLTKLPTLPDKLERLDCYCNQLTELPELPKSLQRINCEWNKITKLPKIPKYLYQITYFNYYNMPVFKYIENPIHNIITKNFNGDIDKYQKWKQRQKKLAIQKIENWFLECKYNPKYAYCRKIVNQGYDILNQKI